MGTEKEGGLLKTQHWAEAHQGEEHRALQKLETKGSYKDCISKTQKCCRLVF